MRSSNVWVDEFKSGSFEIEAFGEAGEEIFMTGPLLVVRENISSMSWVFAFVSGKSFWSLRELFSLFFFFAMILHRFLMFGAKLHIYKNYIIFM